MKTKLATLPSKKSAPVKTLHKIAVWHTKDKPPEIIEGYSAVVTEDGVTIDQGENKRTIKGTVIVQIQKAKKLP